MYVTVITWFNYIPAVSYFSSIMYIPSIVIVHYMDTSRAFN